MFYKILRKEGKALEHIHVIVEITLGIITTLFSDMVQHILIGCLITALWNLKPYNNISCSAVKLIFIVAFLFYVSGYSIQVCHLDYENIFKTVFTLQIKNLE